MADLKTKIDNAIAYIMEKAGAIKRPNGKYLRRQEIRLQGKVARRFKAQMKWIMDNLGDLPYFQNTKGIHRLVTKDVRNDIEAFLRGMPDSDALAEDIVMTAGGTFNKGALTVHQKLKMAEAGVSFDLVNPKATEYLKKLKDLHLSNYRGSILRETRKKIQQILTDAIDKGQSYSEAATKIREQGDAGVFSRARAELIAVNQVGEAYGNGNDAMIRSYTQETGASIEKFWQTVEDNAVTEECRANEDAGWIGMDAHFPSGDSFAPRASNPRCRCVTSYRRLNLSGQPI